MKFKVSSELSYSVKSPSTFIFNIHALRSSNQIVLEESLTIDPFYRSDELGTTSSESRYLRVEVATETELTLYYSATVEVFHQELNMTELDAQPVNHAEGDVLTYLFPSRYCQSDRMFKLAQNLFGHIPNLYEKVMAVTEWIYQNVEYISGSTDSQTSAFDTVTERSGVCRDFAHLGIAFCRALNIPARYFTGYAYQLNPPDFHACFEAYIGSAWIIFDATKMAPLNGLVKIASAKDAADAAVASIFGSVKSNSYNVSCIALEPITPYIYNPQNMIGIAY